MDLEEFTDLFLKKYDDRSKFPKDEEQLKDLILLSSKIIQALREENAALEKMAPCTITHQESSEKTKK